MSTVGANEWVELIDPETHGKYYANIKTGETSWTIPDDIE
jgi:hypothetical protein